MASYLVTGGCGFIGSHLTSALVADGHRVIILDDLSTGEAARVPGEARLVRGDVTDAQLVRGLMDRMDGCFHLAAVASVVRSHRDWIDAHTTNLTGSITVFDAARRESRPVPVVYASSAAVYGDGGAARLAEDAPVRPISAYGADKLGSEQHARVAGIVHGLPTCGLRLFNVFGPGQDARSDYSGVISIFMDRLRHGRELTVFGDGQQTRDFVAVADAVRALRQAMARTDRQAPVFNVCTGRAVSVLELADCLAGLMGTPLRLLRAAPRAGDIRHSVGDPTAAARSLDFRAELPLEEGLAIALSSAASALAHAG